MLNNNTYNYLLSDLKRLKGIGVPNLHLKEIRQVVINFPISIDKQKAYSDYIDKLLIQKETIISTYNSKLIQLEDLKKSILQKAFQGALTNDTIEV